jgi:hypothetical protein
MGRAESDQPPLHQTNKPLTRRMKDLSRFRIAERRGSALKPSSGRFRLTQVMQPAGNLIRNLLFFGALAFSFPSLGAVYTIQYGQGPSPFEHNPPVTGYEVEATGVQNQQGVHGFAVHHNGTDTSYDIPGENYYIDLLHVNSSGQVCGTYNANYGGYGCHSFFWNQGQLSVFSGISDPHVTDMNNQGQVVGNFGHYGSREGFIYDHGVLSTFFIFDHLGSIQYDGNNHSLGGASTYIDAINDEGQLGGHFGLPQLSGVGFWFIASPVSVPEPTATVLLGIGLFGFLALKSRCKPNGGRD